MPIAGNRKLTLPKLDLGGCVLYAPLWPSDMVARGGYIASGTGTMAVTPLALAVGTNTITATGAGTFIVTIPEGGIVASGTATITGSPVTIPAGIATSVTTGITTGNFTVTPSNVIRSRGSNKRALTITGAIKSPYGYDFDGSDDLISTSLTLQQLGISNAITVIAWAKTDTPTATADFLFSCATAAGANIFDIYINGSTFKLYGATAVGAIDITGAATDTSWHFLAATYGGSNDALFYVDTNAPVADTSCSGNIAASGTTNIGVMGDYVSATDNWNGLIGEVAIYSRVLSISAIQNYRLATKWRYQ